MFKLNISRIEVNDVFDDVMAIVWEYNNIPRPLRKRRLPHSEAKELDELPAEMVIHAFVTSSKECAILPQDYKRHSHRKARKEYM